MENKFSDNFDNIRYYFTAIALCHSINVEKDKKNNIKYHSSSPDETALINCARYYKYIYHKKDENNYIHLQTRNEMQKIKLLHTIEYTSER